MAIGDGKVGVVTVPMNGAVTVQPPAGEEWLLRNIGSSTSSASGYPTGITIGLYDGTNYSKIRNSTDNGSWNRKLGLFLTNSTYLRIVDADASADVVAYSAVVTNIAGTTAGRADAKTAIASVAAGAWLTIQPPAGQTWSLSEFGSDQWVAGTAGSIPDVEFALYDGTNTIYITQGIGYFRPWVAILTNAVYGRLHNTSAVTALLSYSAVRMS